MSILPEAMLRAQVCDYLRNEKIWHFVNPANTTYGLPDIIAIIKGYFVGIELKRPDGKGRATTLQKETRNSIINEGGYAVIADSLEKVRDYVELVRSAEKHK